MGIEEKTPEQFRAIIRSIELGRTLIKVHPEIAELYRGGNSTHTIMEELDIQSDYNVGEKIAWVGVYRAITGHGGGFGLNSYVGLISDEGERERLGREHRQENGRRSYEAGFGIHGRTAKQRSKDGREAYSLGLGRRTAKQRSKDGREGNIARGRTPWVTEGIPEIEFAYGLTFLPEYQRGSHVNNELIALKLNILYHDCKEVRTPMAVSSNLYNYRKSLEEGVNDGN